jgi:DNA polymerase III delta prime subunit
MEDDRLSPARFGAAFQAFMEAALREAAPPTNPLRDRVAAHVGTDPARLPVVAEEFETFDHPNLQVALDAQIGVPDRTAELIGIAAEGKRYRALGFADLLSRGGGLGHQPIAEGAVDYVNVRLAGGTTLPCVQSGLYLIRDGARRLVAFVGVGPAPGAPGQKVRVEVLAARPEDATAFLAALLADMARLNVYRGHVIALSSGPFGPGPQALLAFQALPDVGRDAVILPDGVLERIERHTLGVAAEAARLVAAGRSLKRGLLLHGPPGVGKTLTIMYLAGRMPGRTTILATGRALGAIGMLAQLARHLAPALIVLEDVDLIAADRGLPPGQGGGPLLFELLNELDGLRDDCDVIFALTTNRPEALEHALAARPGRVDLAVEFPLPDAAGRRRLLALYARGLALRDVDLDALAARLAGASPAYIKELLRKAALLALLDGGDGVVTPAQLVEALGELAAGGRLAQRLLGLHPDDAPGTPPGPAAGPRDGFPLPPPGMAPGE